MMPYVMVVTNSNLSPLVPRSWSEAAFVLGPRRQERQQQSDESHHLMSPRDQLSQGRYEFASCGVERSRALLGCPLCGHSTYLCTTWIPSAYCQTFYRITFYRTAFYKIAFYRIAFYRIAFYRITFYKIDFYRIAFYRIAFEGNPPGKIASWLDTLGSFNIRVVHDVSPILGVTVSPSAWRISNRPT